LDNNVLIIILFSSFLLLGALGVPIALSLALASFVTSLFIDMSTTFMVQQIFRGVNVYLLLAIPLYLLVGQIMNQTGITKRLTDFAESIVGHIRGGLAHVNVLASMIFAGMSGSSTSDTAGIGAILIPTMIQAGYSKAFTVAITAASSTMGSIIPPSIMAIVYGSTAGVSIAGLFLAGAIPGIAIGVGQMIIGYQYALKNDIKPYMHFSFSRFYKSTKDGIFCLFVPIILVGGLICGIFSPTEAGMVAAVYALFISVAIYKTLKVSMLESIFWETARSTAVIMFMVGFASPFAWMVSYLGLPTMVAGLATRMGGTSPFAVFIFVIILFIISGSFIDATPSIIIFYPIIKSLIDVADIHPVHMGVIVVMTLSFGFLTPPYGLTLLIASSIAGITFTKAMKAMLIFYLFFLIVIILSFLLPDVVLFLPRLVLPNFK